MRKQEKKTFLGNKCNYQKGGKMNIFLEDDEFGVSNEIWNKIKKIIPKPKDNHPLGCHKKRIDNRRAINGILFVLITGCQWKALDKTNICKHSVAHKRFQEWTKARVFEKLWASGLLMYDEDKGIGWKWQSLDGALTKAPLGGEKTGANPTDRAKKGRREVCSPKLLEFLLGLLSLEPIGTIVNSPERLLKVSRLKGQNLQRKTNNTFA